MRLVKLYRLVFFNLFCVITVCLYFFSVGENVKDLIKRPDGNYCFRVHDNRVFYVSEKIMKLAASIPKDDLVTFGTIFGKFTKTEKFILHITALGFLAPLAKVCQQFGINYENFDKRVGQL